MTIEQELLNYTPLPLDIIRFCVEPFLIPDQAHWRLKFNLAVKDIHFYRIRIRYIYRDGQVARGFHRQGRSILVSFKFTTLASNSYSVRYKIRYLTEKPSIISRIKSWFKRHF